MSAENLTLPEGVKAARKSQGMRIVIQYMINFDGWIVRFDTMFEGNQYNIAYRLDVPENVLEANADALIPVALTAWINNAWARGRQIWLANDPRI